MVNKRKVQNDYFEIALKVTQFDVRSSADLNYNLKSDRPIFFSEDDPAFEFETSLDIKGKCYYPKEFETAQFKLVIIGDGRKSRSTSATLKDFHEVDENNVPMYRQYRGVSYPIYKSPPGLSRMEKRRGENIWDVWLWTQPRFVSDVILSLSLNRQLYISMNIRKHKRNKWIEDLSIQTVDPAIE